MKTCTESHRKSFRPFPFTNPKAIDLWPIFKELVISIRIHKVSNVHWRNARIESNEATVLSSDYRFGDGDLGPRGMALFFKSFRHSAMSDSLGIPVGQEFLLLSLGTFSQ